MIRSASTTKDVTRHQRHTLHEQRQESNEEDQEDGNDTVLDPVEDRDEVVASRLSTEHITLRVDLANGQLFVERTEV